MAKKKTKKATIRGPSSVTLRSYQVGFGDCFLLTFAYGPDVKRHMLIDFGSTSKPKNAQKNLMDLVAKDIAAQCGTDPLVVAATHRHKDHISGFATRKDGKGTGDTIAALNVKLVLQPWTEDPAAEPDATVPTGDLPGEKAFVRGLQGMQQVAANVASEIKGLAAGRDTREEIEFIGDDNLKNRSAIDNLASMAKNRYLYFGVDAGVSTILPGVDVTVLGPPSLKQTKEILAQRSKDEDEFWHLAATASAGAVETPKPLFPKYVLGKAGDRGSPPERRWFEARLSKLRVAQLLSIVRALDDAMNNTSLILLLKIGKLRLLFPGDAQIENWSYALRAAKRDPKLMAELKAVNVYKVGHHGSLNATPRSLWELFGNRSKKKTAPNRMRSVMSTMPGKHGSVARNTEVPRKKLVEALERETTHFSTTELAKRTDLYRDLAFTLR